MTYTREINILEMNQCLDVIDIIGHIIYALKALDLIAFHIDRLSKLY